MKKTKVKKLECVKKCYWSKEAAEEALKEMYIRCADRALKPYFCKECRAWHLGHFIF